MIAATDSEDLTIAERVERLAERRRGLDLAELFFAEEAARIARSPDFEAFGHVSPLEWIRKEAMMECGATADRICVGEQAEVIPRSVDAMLAGEIGFAHLVVIARTAERLHEAPTWMGFDEGKLLERARSEDSLTVFRDFCLKHPHEVHPEAYNYKEVASS
jgi:hypothetical protein